jgi:hypothetical protein
VVLVACNSAASVSQQTLERAIALEVQHTQQVLSQQLKLPVPTLDQIKIQNVRVNLQEPTTLQQQPGLHVRGIYDLNLRLQGHQAHQPNNPFEVYLQQQPDRKGWKFAEPAGDGNGWVTTALSLP